jgi:hypothetical protein
METRLVDERSTNRHYVSVQCTLPRNHGMRPHLWHGRAFGEPSKRAAKTRKPRRCPFTEVREVGHRKYGGDVKLMEVRCSLGKGHDGPCAHRGRPFGTDPKRRSRGTTNWQNWNAKQRAIQEAAEDEARATTAA